MATTTNYGWGTPDDTDLVKDGALAIRDLGQDIDTTTKALNPETTTGDIAYRSATANTNTRLALGTAGQVLTVNTGATAPEWATPAATQQILQIVQATFSTNTTTSSASFADTGLTATITPSSASNDILVLVNVASVGKSGGDTYGQFRLVRGASTLIDFADSVGATGTAATNFIGNVSTTYFDAPATTSATTYKVQFANSQGGSTVRINAGGESIIQLIEISGV